MSPASAPLSATPVPAKLWSPKRVLVTPGALSWPHGAAMVERAAALGAEVVKLKADRLAGLPDGYADAKGTLAVVVASPSRRKLQPIPPSADWRFDLAEGCPAHCQYCYLAGSLAGPPITRAYANLPEILGELAPVVGQGRVTSLSPERAAEGTTFEAGCYTDPLAVEHVTGSLAASIAHFGAWDAPVQLRFTTKFDGIEPLLAIPHRGRTRIRFSVNARGATKLAGIGQRVIVGGAHVGAVIVVRGAARINEVLTPIYEALELDWDPAATGSLAAELGEDDAPRELGEDDHLIEATVEALRSELAKAYELRDAPLDDSTLKLAEETKDEYRPRLQGS